MKSLILALLMPFIVGSNPAEKQAAHSLVNPPQWVTVTPRSSAPFLAQKLHTYEARWFWEVAGPEYTAYFVPSPPQVRVLKNSRIFSETPAPPQALDYLTHLKTEELLFERSPFKIDTFISTGNSGHHLHENMYGDFAWDFEILRDGSTYKNNGQRLTDFHVYGVPVFSPVSGVIADIHSDSKDHRPVTDDHGPLSGRDDGNYVLIDMGGGFYVSILHLKKNSLPKTLKKGDRISAGDPLGMVGNSGRTYVPHLHVTTYFYEPRLKRMFSVPNGFLNTHVIEGPAGRPNTQGLLIPETGQVISSPGTCLNH